jgi:hypothetical protein
LVQKKKLSLDSSGKPPARSLISAGETEFQGQEEEEEEEEDIQWKWLPASWFPREQRREYKKD